MAIARKHRAPKAALGRKVSKTLKHSSGKLAMNAGAARNTNGLCDAEDAALVNAVVKAAAARLGK